MVKKKLFLSIYPERFFKVFLPDQSSHRMKFPPAFLKYFSGTIPFKSTIISPIRGSWKVNLVKIEDSLYFQKGWEQFVHDNALVFGDFLVFSYNGNAVFRVQIYGPDGCEKYSICHTRGNCQEISLPGEQTPETRNPKAKGLDFTISKYSKENESIKESSNFVSDFPFFKVVMQPTYVNFGNMNAPTGFIKRHMTRDKKSITLIYSDKSWPIKVTYDRKFTRGWAKFSRDNALEVGDTCVFELIDSNNYVLRVSIFRCSG